MDKKEKIVVVIPVEDRHKKLLEASFPEAEFLYTLGTDITKEEAMEANIIIGNLSPSMFAGSTNLKWVQLNSAGADAYIKPGILPEGVLLTNSTGAYGLALSEHMIASLLLLMKKLDLYMEDQKNHIWGDHGTVHSIYGTKTLVVGLGNVGSEFAVRMNALGSTVTGIRRTKAQKPDYLENLYQMDSLEKCISEADIVASCLPGTQETKYIFNSEMFAKMKPGSYFLNIGRGSSVDSMALADALNRGHLAGACVDVTDPEPLSADHPLWDAKNIVITPHISGHFHLPETFERIVGIAADNLRRYETGKPLKNQVDFTTGYRKLG